jgi:NADH-quinone oxidoreductase subunit G
VRRSAPLQAHPLNRPAQVHVHPEDALAHGLSNGAMVKLDDGVGRAALPVTIDARVARGALWVESVDGASAALAGTGAVLTLSKA